MRWQHPRNMTDVERKKNETKAGTNSSFIAAVMIAA
jgi:hypothetical protein